MCHKEDICWMISKNHKTNKKVEKTKIPMVKPLF